ncbi:MAG: hypothetical protein EU549_03720 [Promethearchaeota archaeon]|nr:MAG: hypothetical protein EU549_03720 [Candidatus Lokiarchaeota archaeon]
MISFLFWICFEIFILVYLYKIVKIRKNKFILGISKFYTGFTLLTIGFILSPEFILQIFNENLLFFGSVFQLIAICMIFYLLIRIEPLSELNWEDKIDDIYIIDKNGICLYHKGFSQEFRDTIDPQIVSGAIKSINVILESITETKNNDFSLIKKKEKILSIFSSNFITGILISNDELKLSKQYLQKLINKIENVYFNVLQDWDNDISIFDPVETIINNILPI